MAIIKMLSTLYFEENYFDWGGNFGTPSYAQALWNVAAPLTASKSMITALGDYDETEMTLSGNFSYGDLGTVAGTVTGYSVSWEGTAVMQVTGMNASAGGFWAGLLSSQRNDALFRGLQGDDKFYGNNAEDEIYLGKGNDKAWGYDGDDRLYGNKGNDILNGGTGNDHLSCGEGKDKAYGGNGRDYIYGWDGNDKLDGGRGNDEIYGGFGSDTIIGGAGDDILSGDNIDSYYFTLQKELQDPWSEEHRLELIEQLSYYEADGEATKDVFKFKKGDGNDVIYGFDPAEDVIQITKGAKKFGDLSVRALTSDQDLDHVYWEILDVVDEFSEVSFGNVSITLVDFDAADVTADMFVFG